MADPLPSYTKRDGVGLPARVFFYTLDQISALISVNNRTLQSSLVHFDGRSVGVHKKDMLLAVNIAPLGKEPIWRVSESEFIRWCKRKQIRVYERGWAQP